MNPTSQFGIVTLDRLAFAELAAASGSLESRKPSGVGSGMDAMLRYRGLDGLAWPDGVPTGVVLNAGLAGVSTYSLLRESAGILGMRRDVVALRSLTAAVAAAPRGWTSIGYDVGYYHDQWSHFSVLLNEVVFGSNSELRIFAVALNHLCLAPTIDVCSRIIAERMSLRSLGRDVEDEEVEPIEILVPETDGVSGFAPANDGHACN